MPKIALLNQTGENIGKIELNDSKDCIIAYEPIWAIGTGKSASVEAIYSVHKFLKNVINEINAYNCNICLLYGGSVNEDNEISLLSFEDQIDILRGVIRPMLGYFSTNFAVMSGRWTRDK